MPEPDAAPARRTATAGFTLVEVLVALAIFALIGVAGFSMLDQVLRTQRLTDGRLERLAEMQRAMHMITLDFAQARGASLTARAGDTGAEVGFSRNAVDAAGGSVGLVYALRDGVLMRDVRTGAASAGAANAGGANAGSADPGADQGVPAARQPLLRGVTAVDWQFYDAGAGWTAQWPPESSTVLPGKPVPNPQAVAMTLILLPDGYQLRRVVLLPAGVR